ncbi:NTP transferase domain-containing protein [Pseudarthrobacter sp. O4]|uniref:NTP transferase domain-containing protein n=1 Tax=Pseudarthrobacter sp. O4 TaxID=3418417 RepID=UPI003CF0CB29
MLLAAGAGARLGLGPKALLRFHGRTLVEVLADVLLAGGCREVVTVPGADAATVRARATGDAGARFSSGPTRDRSSSWTAATSPAARTSTPPNSCTSSIRVKLSRPAGSPASGAAA